MHSYSSIELMLKKHKIDFVDVVTTMETHLNIGKILSKYKIPTSYKNLLLKIYQMQKKLFLYIKKQNTTYGA